MVQTVPPVVARYLPAEQDVQSLAPAAENLPTAHDDGLVFETKSAQNDPALHLEHAEAPADA